MCDGDGFDGVAGGVEVHDDERGARAIELRRERRDRADSGKRRAKGMGGRTDFRFEDEIGEPGDDRRGVGVGLWLTHVGGIRSRDNREPKCYTTRDDFDNRGGRGRSLLIPA